ncbi:MAG: Veg family protein, partial [Clostridia bacterium]|nr:Veg family protein [Clostridia bacterium]
KNIFMIKINTTIKSIKDMVTSFYLKPVTVKLNLGRNKFVTFPATLSGIYPSLFTVRPDDKNFLGKTAYSYSEILCGRVKIEERAAE